MPGGGMNQPLNAVPVYIFGTGPFVLLSHPVYNLSQKGSLMLSTFLQGHLQRGNLPAESLVMKDARVSTSLEKAQKQ
jgi:hypothetical protein